jgi:BioD-like phosphotransacetylase family protein
MRHPLLVLLPVLAILVARPAAAQEPALATVLEKAGAYVLEAQDRLAGVVAEERYVQNAGIAEGNFRRFIVIVDETLGPVKK